MDCFYNLEHKKLPAKYPICNLIRKDKIHSGSIFAYSSPLSYELRMDFQLVTSYKPQGDQPRAIDELMNGLAAGEKHQELLE